MLEAMTVLRPPPLVLIAHLCNGVRVGFVEGEGGIKCTSEIEHEELCISEYG